MGATNISRLKQVPKPLQVMMAPQGKRDAVQVRQSPDATLHPNWLSS